MQSHLTERFDRAGLAMSMSGTTASMPRQRIWHSSLLLVFAVCFSLSWLAHPVIFSRKPSATMRSQLVRIRLLGLFVSLSTFLFIKSTGPLTYNIVGHLKTISILTTGYLFFKEDMNDKKARKLVVCNSSHFLWLRVFTAALARWF